MALREEIEALDRLSGKRQLDVATALSVPDRASLVAFLVERELNELKYKRVTDWFERLHGVVTISCPNDDEISHYAEVKASRDILVHNAKVVNKVYLDKAGQHARYPLNALMEIPGHYHRESWLLIKKIVSDVSAATKAKF
jgi:hypothetical protein